MCVGNKLYALCKKYVGAQRNFLIYFFAGLLLVSADSYAGSLTVPSC